MAGFTINEATIDDLGMLVDRRIEVLRSIFDLSDGCDTSVLEETSRLYYETALADGTHIACLAYDEGEFVGCAGLCLYRQMPSPENPSGNCGYVMNVYTRPAFRRSGVGSAIMEWIIDKARQKGVDRLYLEATKEGSSMYDKLGFKLVEGSMELRLY